jgi:hypothetical protein
LDKTLPPKFRREKEGKLPKNCHCGEGSNATRSAYNIHNEVLWHSSRSALSETWVVSAFSSFISVAQVYGIIVQALKLRIEQHIAGGQFVVTSVQNT